MSRPAPRNPAASPIVIGTALVTLGSAILALALDSVEVRAGALREVSIASPDDRCTRSCVSHVVAGVLPGEPARVVSGSSAFGMELDSGAERIDFSATPPAVPITVETRVSAGIPSGPSATVTELIGFERVRGGRAYVAWRDGAVTNIVE